VIQELNISAIQYRISAQKEIDSLHTVTDSLRRSGILYGQTKFKRFSQLFLNFTRPSVLLCLGSKPISLFSYDWRHFIWKTTDA